jgi:hypothetical protein
MLDGYRSTREAAELLGCPAGTLLMLIFRGRLAPPARRFCAGYVWTDADLDAARHALASPRPAGRPRKKEELASG